jgi:hypothetical protein
MNTPWDALHRAYFNGYAMWTYLTTPFFMALPGFEVREIDPITEGKEVWSGLRARFPSQYASHCEEQDFHFGSDFFLRRHDYRVDVAGSFPTAQYVDQIVEDRSRHWQCDLCGDGGSFAPPSHPPSRSAEGALVIRERALTRFADARAGGPASRQICTFLEVLIHGVGFSCGSIAGTAGEDARGARKRCPQAGPFRLTKGETKP